MLSMRGVVLARALNRWSGHLWEGHAYPSMKRLTNKETSGANLQVLT